MANDKKSEGTLSGFDRAEQIARSTGRGKRTKTLYDHAMTPSDRHALHVVHASKNACTQLAIAIQSGRPITKEAIQACLLLQNEAAGMLY